MVFWGPCYWGTQAPFVLFSKIEAGQLHETTAAVAGEAPATLQACYDGAQNGCFSQLWVLFEGVLVKRAVLFRV